MRNKKTYAALVGAATLGALAFSTGGASSHGYVDKPISRAKLCANGTVSNCGSIQWEPQSVEGPKGFPAAGPADGSLCSAGNAGFKQLDAAKAPNGSDWPATQVSGVLRDLDPSLGVVLANLLTTSEVAVTRQRGTEELLVKYPAAVAAGATAVDGGKVNFGMAVTFFKPLPCTTGYGGTRYRNGLDLGTAPPLNTGAACTAPASSGKNVRGSGNAPKGGPVTFLSIGELRLNKAENAKGSRYKNHEYSHQQDRQTITPPPLWSAMRCQL